MKHTMSVVPVVNSLGPLTRGRLAENLVPRFEFSGGGIAVRAHDDLGHPLWNYPAAETAGPNHHHKGMFIACPVRRFVILGAFLYSFGRPFHDTTPASMA